MSDCCRPLDSWRKRIAELEAQLRDAQGQVAAVRDFAIHVGDDPRAAGWMCDKLLEIIEPSSAASKAILAAAEREQGVREALQEVRTWQGKVRGLSYEDEAELHSILARAALEGEKPIESD